MSWSDYHVEYIKLRRHRMYLGSYLHNRHRNLLPNPNYHCVGVMCDVLIQIGSRNNGKGRKYSPIKPVYALLTQTADFLTARPSLSKVCVIELYNQDVQFSGTMSQQKITKAKNIFVNLLKKHGDTCAYWKSLNTLTWAPRDPPLHKTK